MKKVFVVLLLSYIPSYFAKADVFVRGKLKKVSESNGNTEIWCKGSRGNCFVVDSDSKLYQFLKLIKQLGLNYFGS
jgi:hypothetical protein